MHNFMVRFSRQWRSSCIMTAAVLDMCIWWLLRCHGARVVPGFAADIVFEALRCYHRQDYSLDFCRFQFTAGQRSRMHSMYKLYRASRKGCAPLDLFRCPAHNLPCTLAASTQGAVVPPATMCVSRLQDTSVISMMMPAANHDVPPEVCRPTNCLLLQTAARARTTLAATPAAAVAAAPPAAAVAAAPPTLLLAVSGTTGCPCSVQTLGSGDYQHCERRQSVCSQGFRRAARHASATQARGTASAIAPTRRRSTHTGARITAR